DELTEAGIEVMFITTPAPKNEEDKILHGVKGLFAQYERAKISERFRMGKLRKVREGHILTTEALYGYTYIPKKDNVHGYYEINEDEARVVRMIFSWVADEKMTLRGIVKRLQELKIKPRKSKRGVWATSTLSTMLRHKGYIGEAHWGSSYAVIPENPLKEEKYKKQKKTSRKKRPEEDWYTIAIPRIIDPELFERTRKQLEDSSKQSIRNKKNEFLLSNKIWCPCGYRRCGCGPQRGKYLYYRCNDRINRFPLPAQCAEGGINARIADEKVWQKLTSLMASPDLMLKQAERWHKEQQAKPEVSLGNIKDLKEERDKLKEQEERYNKAYGVGAFDIDQLVEYTTPIQERVRAIESSISKTEQESNQIAIHGTPHREDLERFAYKASRMLQNLSYESKREIVLNTIDKVVGNQRELKVTGFINTNNVTLHTEYRNCRVAQRRKIDAF
ncbi:MAG: recombinase family protein, partial [Candidatus Paceibacterota bacterium]